MAGLAAGQARIIMFGVGPLPKSIMIAPFPQRSRLNFVSDLIRLSDREREVLQFVAGGFTNGEIGIRLGIATSTVRNHLYRIYRLYGTSSRVESVIYGISIGDVRLNVAIASVRRRLSK